MKYFLVLAVVCGAIGFSEQTGLTREQFDEMVDKFLADCAAQEGAGPDDIKFLKDNNLPTNAKQMCMVACAGENLGFMKNGREDVENSIKTVESVIGPNHPLMSAVRDIAHECGDVAMPDRCESSTAVYKCAKDGAAKRNFKLEDVI